MIAVKATFRVIRVTLLLLVLSVLGSAPAIADASDDVVRSLDINIVVQADGGLQVTETYEWDFGTRQGLGFTRVLDARFEYPPDRSMERVYRYDDFSVYSPSAAPADVWVRQDGPQVAVDVGAPDGSSDRRTGVQTYVLSYTVEGAMNPIRGQDGVADQDELYWNVTGHEWNNRIEDVTTTISGPAEIVDEACYMGQSGSGADCTDLQSSSSQVVATADSLRSGEGLTVMAAFPADTFTDISPLLEPSERGALSRWTDPLVDFMTRHAALLIPLGVAVPIGLGVLRVRRNRDLIFEHFPPGVIPPQGPNAPVRMMTVEPPVAVRFEPPEVLTPAETGALMEKRATPKHMSATIISLASRGYLRIEEAGTNLRGTVNDWTLIATPESAPNEQLRDYERYLLQSLFAGRTSVQISALRNRFATNMRTAKKQLRHGIDASGYFVKKLRSAARTGGNPFAFIWGVFVVGFLLRLIDTSWSSSAVTLGVLVAVFLVLVIIVNMVTARRAQQRTALGRALYEQARGFEEYISKAEGRQLQFEEGEDIFSRFLPYAIVFGVADRWASIIADLAEQGYNVGTPTWYVGSHGHFSASSFRGLSSSMSSFASTASSALSSTPGSSGGSGSSGGGGGSSGGGGGGGGGGGR